MREWIVTIPKTVKWEDYLEELKLVADGSQVLNYKLKGQPKHMEPGDRMYITHDGIVQGWMTISGLVWKPQGFTCTTTGREWEKGWYAERTGRFHVEHGAPYPGFRGFREYKRS